MMPHIVKVWLSIPPIVIDGALAMTVAGIGAYLGYISQEEAYKYFDPTVLYHTKGALVTAGGTFSALQFFRSKAYADYSARKQQRQDKETEP